MYIKRKREKTEIAALYYIAEVDAILQQSSLLCQTNGLRIQCTDEHDDR